MRFVDLPHVIYNGLAITGDKSRRLHLQAYDRVDIWVQVTAVSGTPDTGTLDVKLQHRAPREAGTWIDITNKAITQVTKATSFPNAQVISLSEADIQSEDIRILFDVGFTGGTTPSFTVDCYYQGRAN